MAINTGREVAKTDKSYIIMLSVIIFAPAATIAAYYFHDTFERLMSLASYLSWHNIFETISIVVCFSVFFVSYYSYNQTGRLRTIFIGCLLLVIGSMDLFHTLSFKGMPSFFIENLTANRATTFWILSRLILGVGFLTAVLIPLDRKSKLGRRVFIIPSLLIAIVIFIIVTYFPGWLPEMYVEGQGLTRIKVVLEYVVMLLMAGVALIYLRDYLKTRDMLSSFMCSAFILGISSEFLFTLYFHVTDIFNYTGHIFKALMFFIILRVIISRDVQRPYIELSAAQKELREYADNLDRIVEQRTRQLKATNRKLTEDLEYARDIQKAMLPVFLPDTSSVSFNSWYLPAERLSGDFYDVFRLDEQHLAFCICDVSGHGVPAAMLTVFLKQALWTGQDMDRSSGKISCPSAVLKNLYESFNRTNFKDDVYIVMIYAIYNEATKKLVLSSAGMNTPPMLVKSDGNVTGINIGGFPICKISDIIDVGYTDISLELQSGDKLLFYSDGLIEAQNSSRERYAADRLKTVLERNAGLNGRSLSKAIIDDLNSFLPDNRIKDDMTFLLMDVK